jgi:hypothetical protein
VPNLPIFDVEAFTRHLDDSQWRWYSHDPATLRAADHHYRDFDHLNRESFAFFDRTKVSLETQIAEEALVGHDSFLDDAAKGQLRRTRRLLRPRRPAPRPRRRLRLHDARRPRASKSTSATPSSTTPP